MTFDSTGNRVGNSVRISQYMRGEELSLLVLMKEMVLINEVS